LGWSCVYFRVGTRFTSGWANGALLVLVEHFRLYFRVGWRGSCLVLLEGPSLLQGGYSRGGTSNSGVDTPTHPEVPTRTHPEVPVSRWLHDMTVERTKIIERTNHQQGRAGCRLATRRRRAPKRQRQRAPARRRARRADSRPRRRRGPTTSSSSTVAPVARRRRPCGSKRECSGTTRPTIGMGARTRVLARTTTTTAIGRHASSG
jgi:hypothetical protein